VGFDKYGTGEVERRFGVWEDADDIGAAFDLSVEAFGALRHPRIGSLPRAGADHRGQLGVDQRLADRLRRGTDPILSASSAHRVEHLE
jgi:hypothetical protein